MKMDEFLRLSLDDQAEILNTKAADLGRSAKILEKDIWVCWALEKLFSISNGPRMVFKGGTSLSKIFKAINRFSEDIDVTIDYRDLSVDVNPFDESISTNKWKQICQELRQLLQKKITEHIEPPISNSFKEITKGMGKIKLELSEDANIVLFYPTKLETENEYIEDSIKLEFGGRNSTEPNIGSEIEPDIAPSIPKLQFPRAHISVLSPQRTFWEKATLIHFECNRNDAGKAHRLSRHWYDLHKLSQLEIGKEALSDTKLLRDVILHKSVFFYSKKARYNDCVEGGFKLAPDGPLLDAISRDYRQMIESGMFYGAPPTFDDIIKSARDLEKTINH
jgi:Nucleotidyl transferase AbiEii toxin, Type IV TA system